MAGLRLPIETHVLQAFVSRGLKPMIDGVITFGAGHFYISQSDKGGLVFGGDIDGYNSYAQRGTLPIVEDVVSDGIAMVPALSRVRVLRQWAGIMDMTMDGSPIIGKTPIDGLYLNGGWCYGGFKAIPGSGWCFAHTIATDAPHPLNAAPRPGPLSPRAAPIDENGAGPVALGSLTEQAACMLASDAPWCGERDEVEFTLSRRCHRARPILHWRRRRRLRRISSIERDNPAGWHADGGFTSAAAAVVKVVAPHADPRYRRDGRRAGTCSRCRAR